MGLADAADRPGGCGGWAWRIGLGGCGGWPGGSGLADAADGGLANVAEGPGGLRRIGLADAAAEDIGLADRGPGGRSG